MYFERPLDNLFEYHIKVENIVCVLVNDLIDSSYRYLEVDNQKLRVIPFHK